MYPRMSPPRASPQALAGTDVERGAATTGRVNLHARQAGLLRLDAARIHAANRVHEGLTIATLLPDAPVDEGQMLATVKIIPYAVPAAALDAVLGALGAQRRAAGGAMARHPRCPGDDAPRRDHRVGAGQDAWRGGGAARAAGRFAGGGAGGAARRSGAWPRRCAGCSPAPDRPQLLLVSGVAATVDRGDIVPAAVLAAGGRVLHAGMPVDPGNLLVLGELADGGGAAR